MQTCLVPHAKGCTRSMHHDAINSPDDTKGLEILNRDPDSCYLVFVALFVASPSAGSRQSRCRTSTSAPNVTAAIRQSISRRLAFTAALVGYSLAGRSKRANKRLATSAGRQNRQCTLILRNGSLETGGP